MKKQITRRDFLKNSAIGIFGGILVAPTVPDLLQSLVSLDSKGQQAQAVATADKRNWKFIVNIDKCIGCGRCVKACKLENNVPLLPTTNRTWVERYLVTRNEEIIVDSPNAGINGFTDEPSLIPPSDIRKSFFVPKLCNQCNKPPCVQVCPVKATYATPEGVVLINQNACIGCRYCVQACPYGARYFDPRTRVVDKCTWCYHRITKGLMPACVEVCPVGGRVFGELKDAQSPLEKMLRQQTISVLKPEVGTEPKVYYIGLEKGVR